MIIGGELIRQSDAPVRPVLFPFPATLEAEGTDQSVTPSAGLHFRSASERRVSVPAVPLWKSARRVKGYRTTKLTYDCPSTTSRTRGRRGGAVIRWSALFGVAMQRMRRGELGRGRQQMQGQ